MKTYQEADKRVAEYKEFESSLRALNYAIRRVRQDLKRQLKKGDDYTKYRYRAQLQKGEVKELRSLIQLTFS